MPIHNHGSSLSLEIDLLFKVTCVSQCVFTRLGNPDTRTHVKVIVYSEVDIDSAKCETTIRNMIHMGI